MRLLQRAGSTFISKRTRFKMWKVLSTEAKRALGWSACSGAWHALKPFHVSSGILGRIDTMLPYIASHNKHARNSHCVHITKSYKDNGIFIFFFSKDDLKIYLTVTWTENKRCTVLSCWIDLHINAMTSKLEFGNFCLIFVFWSENQMSSVYKRKKWVDLEFQYFWRGPQIHLFWLRTFF